jgi:hypothetical protein
MQAAKEDEVLRAPPMVLDGAADDVGAGVGGRAEVPAPAAAEAGDLRAAALPAGAAAEGVGTKAWRLASKAALTRHTALRALRWWRIRKLGMAFRTWMEPHVRFVEAHQVLDSRR